MTQPCNIFLLIYLYAGHIIRGDAMKCLACGREMIDRGNHFECSNFLCDYEEDIDTLEVLIVQSLQTYSSGGNQKCLNPLIFLHR